MTLHSERLDAAGASGVPHGFTTAAGGLHIGTAAHLRPVLDSMQLNPRRVVMTRQVHGGTVTTAASRCEEADAHVTDDPDEMVAVRTADCAPILLASADGSRVAAIHAGWRGLLAGVIDNTLQHFEAAAVRAAVGPCIGVEHYEVGPEVAERFAHGVVRPASAESKARLDLRAVALEQLLVAGVAADHIGVARHCTHADAARFHSYRRQGTGCGHMAAFIGPAGR